MRQLLKDMTVAQHVKQVKKIPDILLSLCDTIFLKKQKKHLCMVTAPLNEDQVTDS